MTERATRAKDRVNWWLDVALALGYAITVALGFYNASLPEETRFLSHELLSLGVAAAALVHVGLHWRWTVQVTRSFYRLSNRARVNYVLAAVLALLFGAMVLSGLLISDLLGAPAGGSTAFKGLHHLTTKLSILAVVTHVALHWRWVANTIRSRLRSAPAETTVNPKGVE